MSLSVKLGMVSRRYLIKLDRVCLSARLKGPCTPVVWHRCIAAGPSEDEVIIATGSGSLTASSLSEHAITPSKPCKQCQSGIRQVFNWLLGIVATTLGPACL
jgi:hypothetical protein